MRLPRAKIYRGFTALDRYTDSECRSLVRRVRANYETWQELLPVILSSLLAVIWWLGWPIAGMYTNLATLIPLLPQRHGEQIIVLIVSGAVVSLIALYVLRDVILYFAIMHELRRTDCRKCGQSLIGLRLDIRGIHPDPANVFVRCAECGKVYCLLDVGLTSRDLLSPGSSEEIEQVGKLRR